MTAAKKDILQGWKEIAGYVARDVRTVKRWEKQRGLPVRRMPGEGRANIYALIPEVDRWLSEGVPPDMDSDELDTSKPPSVPLESLFAPATADLSASSVPDTYPETPNVPSILDDPSTFPADPIALRRWMVWAAAVLCLAVIVFVAYVRVPARSEHRVLASTPQSTSDGISHSAIYRSRQPHVTELYLRGVYFTEQRTPDTLNRALDCFQQAIKLDPSYAPALAGLAQTYNLVREYSMMPPAEAYPAARSAAERAIALDPSLSEAHASLAFVDFFWSLDAVAAEREFHTSIALAPNSALAHHWYGSMLTHQARYPEALAELDLAQHLQPDSTAILSSRAYALGLSGQRNEAADILQEVITQAPNLPSPHRILGIISLVEPRDVSRYLYELGQFATLRHDAQQLRLLQVADDAFRHGGEPAMWRAILADQRRTHPDAADTTYLIASAEAALGQNEAAMQDLAVLAKRRDPSLLGLLIDPVLRNLQTDPRFQAIIAESGLRPPR